MEKRLQRIADLMKKEYGETVVLFDYYGPVQMCVFGLTYSYLPTNERIVFECERGVITVKLVDIVGNTFFPSEYFEESNYTHWEDNDNDLQELIFSIKRLVELKKQFT